MSERKAKYWSCDPEVEVLACTDIAEARDAAPCFDSRDPRRRCFVSARKCRRCGGTGREPQKAPRSDVIPIEWATCIHCGKRYDAGNAYARFSHYNRECAEPSPWRLTPTDILTGGAP